MNDLVMVKNKEVWVDSHIVAKKFGLVHGVFVLTIKKTIKDYPDILEFKTMSHIALNSETVEKYYTEERHYRGTDFTVYIMNREFFSLVSMRLTSKRARQWQRKFNQAFYEMERRLLKVETNASDVEWNSTRLIGKTARLEETDAIKDFVDYATKQGSKSAKFYYKHITNAAYKALGLMAQRNPKLRDEMGIYELSELMLAERLAANKIKKYMELGRNYKDIYNSVKEDLIIFSNSLKLNQDS